MTQEIEMESKNLLTKKEYIRLLHFFSVDDHNKTKQRNYYFETEDFQLKENGSALRIREKQNQWMLTLKQPYQDGLLETHHPLSKEQVDQWLQGNPCPAPTIDAQLKDFGVERSALEYGGSLETERIEIPYKNTTVVLDFSRYNGLTDYELEVEANSLSLSQEVMEELLTSLEIKQKTTPNKIERFYQSLQSN